MFLKKQKVLLTQKQELLRLLKISVKAPGRQLTPPKLLKKLATFSQAKLPPLPPRSALVKDGRGLANLSPEAFGMVVNEVVPINMGAIVGRLVKDPLQQAEALRVIAKLKDKVNATQAEIIVKDMLSQGTEMATTTVSLFGKKPLRQALFLNARK
jgi:hypothetical protein